MVKNLPTSAVDAGDSSWILGWEDPLEEEMATHSSMPAWKTPWQRSLVGYSPWGQKKSDMTEHAHRSHSRLYHSVSTLAFSSAQNVIPSKCLLLGSVSPFSVLLESVL